MAYWQDRMAQAQSNVSKKTTKQIETQLRKYYKASAQKVMDDFVSTYEKMLATVAEGKDYTPADLYKLDKYWKLQADMRKELRRLGERQVALLTKNFEREFFDVYYIFSKEGSASFNTLDTSIVQQMINQIWCADGKSWSQRIWDNTEELAETLNEGLIHIVASGKRNTDLKRVLQERFNVSYSKADALVRTEVAHIQTQAAVKRYEDYGITEVEIWADEDERRCDVCGKLHKKRFPVGANIPIPAHPRCRCCIVPVVEDGKEEEWKEVNSKQDKKTPNLTSKEKNDIIPFTDEELSQITSEAHQINPKIGTAINYINIKITDLGVHGSQRMSEKGVSQENAQSYIDKAIMCFQQSKDKIYYISEDGVTVVSRDGRIMTTYPKSWFDDKTKQLLEVLRKWQKK